MPGLRPQPHEPEDDDSEHIPFGYMTLQSQGGDTIFAMTFQQLIEFLGSIEETLDDDEEIVADYFGTIKRLLRGFIQDGD